MKALILCFSILLAYNSTKGQLVPELYNDKLTYTKKALPWNEKVTTIIEIEKGKEQKYIISKVEVDENGAKTHTFYNDNGSVKEVNTSFFENDRLHIYSTKDGNKEEIRYDENGNITSIKWTYPNGSIDESTYSYKDSNLVKIVEKDPFDTYTEVLNYENEKLIEILSIDEDGTTIMTRKFSYNRNGKIKKMERVQDDQINKTVHYSYDDSNRLVLKEEKKLNRFTGVTMPPEIREYTYHNNGVLKEDKWTIFANKNRTIIKDLYSTEYNELGLEIKETIKDFSDLSEQIYLYHYKLK